MFEFTDFMYVFVTLFRTSALLLYQKPAHYKSSFKKLMYIKLQIHMYITWHNYVVMCRQNGTNKEAQSYTRWFWWLHLSSILVSLCFAKDCRARVQRGFYGWHVLLFFYVAFSGAEINWGHPIFNVCAGMKYNLSTTTVYHGMW